MNGSEADVLILPRVVGAAGGSDFNLGFLCRAGLSPFSLVTAHHQDLRPNLRTISVIISFESPSVLAKHDVLTDYSMITHRKNIRPLQQQAKNARITVIIRFIRKV